MRVTYGNGDGTFQTAIGLNTTINHDPRQVITGDFNGDGLIDLAVALGSDDLLAIYTRKSTGALVKSLFTAPGRPMALATGDLNHDGFLDIVTVNADDSTLSVFLNQSTASLPQRQSFRG